MNIHRQISKGQISWSQISQIAFYFFIVISITNTVFYKLCQFQYLYAESNREVANIVQNNVDNKFDNNSRNTNNFEN